MTEQEQPTYLRLHQERARKEPTAQSSAEECFAQVPFAAVPISVVRDPNLTPAEVRLISLLISYANEPFPAIRTLARDMGVSMRSTHRTLRNLRVKGLVPAPASP